MRINLRDVLRDKESHEPIWVINKTRGEVRGPVTFGVPKINGQGTDAVRIPDTFLPINLVDQFPRELIVQSNDFRNAINSEMLWLIDDEEAEELLAKPGVKQEKERLRKEASRHQGAYHQDIGEQPGAAPAPNPQARQLSAEEQAEADVTPKVVSVINRIGESGEIAVINSLRAISEDLTRRDLTYIREVAAGRGYEKLASFERNLSRKLSS